MKKIFYLGFFIVAMSLTIVAQEENEQVVVPIKFGVEGEAAVEDTTSTLIVAEGQAANLYYNEAVKAFAEGNFDIAIVKYSMAIKDNPTFAKAILGRATSFMQKRLFADAILDFDSYLSLTPNDGSAYYYRGYAKYYQKKYEDAIADFDLSLANDYQKDVNLFYLYGVSKFYLEQYESAIEKFSKAIELDESYAFAYNDRASSYRMLQKYPEAIADYTKAIESDSTMSIFYNNLGSTYRLNNEYDKAIALF